MGRVRRMQISPITHAGYFAIIIAVHARGRISYDGEFRGYPSRLEKFTMKYCPLNPEPLAVRIFVTPMGCVGSCILADLRYENSTSLYRYSAIVIVGTL